MGRGLSGSPRERKRHAGPVCEGPGYRYAHPGYACLISWGGNVTSNHRWTTSVNAMTLIFREALVALIPTAERAHMPWREPANYDDWDLIAQSLFQSIVVSSLEHADEWKFPYKIPKYDTRIGDYSQNSFVSALAFPMELAFICFETKSSPFDVALFARLDATGKVVRVEREQVDRVHFVLSGCSANSNLVVDSVSVHL
jgi:hypothetical protein